MNLEDLYRLLRAGHVQAQGVVDTIEAPLLVVDQQLCVQSGNAAFFEAFHVTKDETLGEPLARLGNGQWDIPELRRLLSEVVPKSAAVIGYEVTHDFPGLGRRTMLVTARKLVEPASGGSSMLVVFEDVTSRRHAEAEKDIQLAETRHRMKNLLATVRALANQTIAEGRSGVEYRDSFLGRFEALMAAQDTALSGRSTADFAQIVETTAKLAGQDGAFVCRGPPVTLSPRQVLPLSLVLHELGTNALKHGALSVEGGKVTVDWSLTEAPGGGEALVIEWREENGPAVTPPRRSGFGSQLIEFSVKQDLEGVAELRFEPEGFRGAFRVPMG